MNYLDITEEELQIVYEEIMVFLGAVDIEVDLEKSELLIALRDAILRFNKEVSIWQLQNQFINTYGMPAGLVMTNQLATVNYALVRQITDWFASMQRVGGKIPWHKDYITLEPGRQIYFLDKESSKPYPAGTRRINRVMWVAKPESMSAAHFNSHHDNIAGDDVLYSNSWNFSNSGLNYGSNRLGFLGYTFDTILMKQAIENRNKILYSEFFHNLSGDVLEITPMPGASVANITRGTRVFYYYFDEAELYSGQPSANNPANQTVYQSTEDYNPGSPNNVYGLPPGQSNLIANPADMKIEAIPWSYLSPWAKCFVKEVAFARCKYIQAAKWRKIKQTYSTGEMEYQIDLDYTSLLQEAQAEEQRAVDMLRQDLERLNISTLMNQQKEMTDAAVQVSKREGRLWFIGTFLIFALSPYLMI
jgi:hypothetical protein